MKILVTGNDADYKTITDKIERITDSTCNKFNADKKKFIVKMKKDKEMLRFIINSFLLKQKLYGLSDEELVVFNMLKSLK